MQRGLKDNGKYVAFSYFFHRSGTVYYGSSSDDPEYIADIPLEHPIIWAAIKYYKQRNFKKFEIGWQYFGKEMIDNPTEKDISISFFKRGFGGEILNLYRGIKYRDARLGIKDLMNAIKGQLKK